MKKYSGWLFDLYAHPTKGVVLWLVGEDGKPYSFYQDFETVFYARGEFPRLHELGEFIRRVSQFLDFAPQFLKLIMKLGELVMIVLMLLQLDQEQRHFERQEIGDIGICDPLLQNVITKFIDDPLIARR